jgi:hypothetical protein
MSTDPNQNKGFDPSTIPVIGGLFAPNPLSQIPLVGGIISPGGKQVQAIEAPKGGTADVQVTGSPFSSFFKDLPYFVVLGGVLLLTQQSDKYAGLGTALAALIVVSYGFTHYNGIVTGFNAAFGTGLPGAAQ